MFDDSRAYAVKVFARRNRLSPLFFTGTDGYFLLIFAKPADTFVPENTAHACHYDMRRSIVADRQSTGAVLVNPRQQSKYLTWLPQEGKLQMCWNLDVGFARATPPEWMKRVAVRLRAMLLASNTLWAAGTPDEVDPGDPLAALEGRRGARLLAFDAAGGRQIAQYRLEAPPVFDGLSAAAGHFSSPPTTDASHALPTGPNKPPDNSPRMRC